MQTEMLALNAGDDTLNILHKWILHTPFTSGAKHSAISEMLPMLPYWNPGQVAPLIIPGNVSPIALESVAPVWCYVCSVETAPVPMSSSSQGWIMYPCHEEECDCCYNVGEKCQSCGKVETCHESCDDCGECETECTCTRCAHCSDVNVEWCGRCSDYEMVCRDCCSCSEYVTPGWESRNVIRPTDRPASVQSIMADDLASIDPVQSMADFYLLDYVRTVASMQLRKTSDRVLSEVVRDCARLQDVIVARCDGAFQDYVFAAIGGEVRHHCNVSDLPSSRSSAWDYFYAMGELNGREELTDDCVDIFDCDSWGGSYGGPAWRTIARTLHDRLTGRLDARTFVDRVFSLQHNGGSLLNKMSWASLTAYGYDVQFCQNIGNAHDAIETDFSTLMSCASADVIMLAIAATPAVPERDRDRFAYGLSDARRVGTIAPAYELPAFRGVYPRPFDIRQDAEQKVHDAAYQIMLGYTVDAAGSPIDRVRDADWASWETEDGYAGYLVLAQMALSASESVNGADASALALQAILSDLGTV